MLARRCFHIPKNESLFLLSSVLMAEFEAVTLGEYKAPTGIHRSH